ncbi:NAD-dependent epimerase/dehydratase family protein [Planktomarina temperata]|nr:NAD-dependent epimerase/dehydratase family protein [Planktomarina temperata]
MQKTVLITGGAGFIGSSLSRYLLDQGHQVVVVDDLSASRRERVQKECLFIHARTQELKHSDLPEKIDLIYHLGEYSRVENSFEAPDAVLTNNLNSCAAIVNIARTYNSKLVYSGSSTKFGDGGLNKYQTPYALSKYLNTELVNSYCAWYKMKYAISYFYNVYGPNENAEGEFATVVAKFLKQAQNGEQLQVTSPGTQRRNFTHIDDTIAALSLIGELGVGDGYGIASDESFSILELAKMITEDYRVIPPKPGNRLSSSVETQKTKELGWKVKNNLRDYIRKNLMK